MQPTLFRGDLIIYRPFREGDPLPEAGEIVVVIDPFNPDSLIIKRVLEFHVHGLELRGDNETKSIDSRQYGIVNHKQLCGVVEQVFSASH